MVFTSMILALLTPALPLPQEGGPISHGVWRGWLDSPGGELPFLMEVGQGHEFWGHRIWLINGQERIEIPKVLWAFEEPVKVNRPIIVTLDFPHYDSKIVARLDERGTKMEGTWYKRRGLDQWLEMPFHARNLGIQETQLSQRFAPTPVPLGMPQLGKLAERYAVDFAASDDLAICLFDPQDHGEVNATFLTTTGDYRYLAGRIDGDRLRLSVFDGAHAFLFTARLIPNENKPPSLAGDFWSSDRWHEKWTAKPDSTAKMPDPWLEVGLLPESQRPDWRELAYPGLDGKLHKLGADEFKAKARLLVVFGTWCPNCHDESAYLKELHQRYSPKGLGITALAFEISGDQSRDLAQIKRYRDQLDIPYPILLAGVANKSKAAKAFPIVSQIKSYPTTLFIDKQGKIRAVWSGFSGPATGVAHQKLRARFEQRIEELLAE